MIAVLDTNVLVSGLCRVAGSTTYAIVRSLGQDWDVAVTPAIFLEYESVLLRPRIRQLTGLRPHDVRIVLEYLADAAERVAVSYAWRPNLRDESDNKFVDCAVAAGANYLITGNTRDFLRPDLGPFGFEVVKPARFVELLGLER